MERELEEGRKTKWEEGKKGGREIYMYKERMRGERDSERGTEGGRVR